jgi:hypothetical protein
MFAPGVTVELAIVETFAAQRHPTGTTPTHFAQVLVIWARACPAVLAPLPVRRGGVGGEDEPANDKYLSQSGITQGVLSPPLARGGERTPSLSIARARAWTVIARAGGRGDSGDENHADDEEHDTQDA